MKKLLLILTLILPTACTPFYTDWQHQNGPDMDALMTREQECREMARAEAVRAHYVDDYPYVYREDFTLYPPEYYHNYFGPSGFFYSPGLAFWEFYDTLVEQCMDGNMWDKSSDTSTVR